MLNNKTILITGGTGSFGKKFVETVLQDFRPSKLIVFSRGELEQHKMRQQFPDDGVSPIRYFIGDVRDRNRLYRAFQGVNTVIHAAAIKQVPVCEYNPIEAILTNIVGAWNILDAAIDCGVSKVIGLSSDKACQPINIYGATKLVMEKLFVQGNAYAGGRTQFSCVRYGNVIGSRGSVIPLFLKQREQGTVTITDGRMTRFWITLEQGVNFVIRCLSRMQGGEVFVPKIPSMRVMDLARAIAPECNVNTIGIRPGEKLHEVLVNRDEARQTLDLEDMYIIQPSRIWWDESKIVGEPLPDGFKYTSDLNDQWLTVAELQEMIDEIL
jgi:UDP-N-acetylglucosamine 4,6-dehydratase/5-epimerase